MEGRRGAKRIRGIALLLVVGMAGGPSMAGNGQPEDEIRALDGREAEAMLAADVAALGRIWSPAFVVNAPDHRVKSRDEVLEAVRGERIRYAAFRRTVERVVLHGDHAVSMGGEVVTPRDAERSLARRYTHVWQRRDGGWVLAARHANVIPAPAD